MSCITHISRKSSRCSKNPENSRCFEDPEKSRRSTRKQKKMHRRDPGTVALREIRRYKRTTERLIGKSPFRRLVREIAYKLMDAPRFQSGAISALQEITEEKLVYLFKGSHMCALHHNCITIRPEDIMFACGMTQDELK